MKLPEPPPDWGNDELTKFLDCARANTFAAFDNLKSDYKKLSAIDDVFEVSVQNLHHTAFAALFVFQAHSAFRAALCLVFNGQITETQVCLRLVLENALYGFYFSKNPTSLTTWLNRHVDKDERKKVVKEFKIRGEHQSLLATLKASSKPMGDIVEALYEYTIDFGAHPNKYGLKQRTRVVRDEENVKFDFVYLLRGDAPESRLALRTVSQVGVCALSVFRLIYAERFDILGLSETIDRLRKGL
jgi:hypothetical protein